MKGLGIPQLDFTVLLIAWRLAGNGKPTEVHISGVERVADLTFSVLVGSCIRLSTSAVRRFSL